jgi:hypothetical protein
MSSEESFSYLKMRGIDLKTVNLVYSLVGGRLSLLKAMVLELNSGTSFEGITILFKLL